jgi:two-component system, response regulator YesN
LEKDLLMVMGRFDNINPSIEYKKKTEIFYSILLIANEYFKPYLVEAGTYDENDNVIWFLQPKINNALEQKGIKEWKRTDVFLKGMLEMIQVSSRKSMNLNISFSLSSKAIRWSDIQEEYIFLNQLLDFNTGTAEEMILTSSDLRSQHVNPDINKRIKQISVSLKNVNALQNFLEKGQRNEYFKLLEDVIKVFRKIDSLHFNPLLELYYSISVMFLSFINRWGFTEKIAFSIGLSKLTHIEEFSTWEDAKAYIEKISEVIFRLQSEEKKGKTKDVISQVNQFIAENTSEELSLIQISEQVHFNPSYLSRLYKQETGENLSDYITRIRIDKAKFLLENSNLKIHEIAKAVGYETAHNFTRFFKKIMRVTPQEYRDGILKGKQMR